MRSSCIYQCVIVMACSALVVRVDGVPRYAPTTPQVGEVETKSPILSKPNSGKMTPTNNGRASKPDVNVLERIKQDEQTCKTGSNLDSPSASQLSKDKKTAVGNRGFNITTGVSPMLVAAALSLSDSKLAEIAKDAYCFQNNSQRAKKNSGTPETISDVRSSGLYRELSEELSILHNFREDLKLDTIADRLKAGLQAAAEYKAWKDHKMDRSEWKYLDPDLPNVKFIEENGGHKEAVYNRHTGKRVDHGNNQGTYNDYDQDSSLIEKALHGVKDVGDWGLCGTPADNAKISAKWSAALAEILLGLQSEEIDTSELEELLKEQLVFLESLLAKGKRAADSEIDVYNARQKKLAHVTMGIAGKINSLSVPDEEKQRIAEEKLAKATALAMQVQKLVDQVVEKKLIGGLKPLALTDLNGAAPAQATEDNGGCKCKNPSPHYVKVSDDIPAAVRCTRCGKIVGVAHHGKIIRASRP